jgi:alanine racemase
MLYGANPFAGQEGCLDAHLRPVMQLTSAVISVRMIPIGEAVGYGGTFVAERVTRVGVVACGYADGYPRVAPTGTPVAVDGKLTRLIGRVSMDMLMVDLTDLPETGLGSRVELWGEQVPVSGIAGRAGTIAYELLCNVKRVRFVYTDTLTEESL